MTIPFKSPARVDRTFGLTLSNNFDNARAQINMVMNRKHSEPVSKRRPTKDLKNLTSNSGNFALKINAKLMRKLRKGSLKV